MRFNALRRGIGDISRKMLATSLRVLERDGFVVRTVAPTTPPHVEHGLTDLGRRLLGPVCALARLTIANADSIEERRPHAPREDGGLRTGGARDFSAP